MLFRDGEVRLRRLFGWLCRLAVLCLFVPFVLCTAKAAEGTAEYLTTVQALNAALSRREPVIYVDDIAFSEGNAYITLNYNVRIVGKAEKSTLTGAHFEVVGQVTAEPGKNVTVEFENLCFDGGVNAADYELTREAPFAEIFGSDREKEVCVHASFGYFDVSFTNCDFTRYAAHRGAAVYCDNSIDFPVADRSFAFTGCKFYGNIVQYGTCDIFGDRLITTVTDCEFSENYAMAQAGMNIGNGAACLTNVRVHDNYFVPYDEPNAQNNAGGGMNLGAADVRAQGLVIENNTAYWGGGLALVSAKAGNKEIVLSDCRICGNTALRGGGALHIDSLMGQPIYFRNCAFTDNTAPLGSSLYAIPYAAWNGKYTAGLIDFTFCTFTGNTAEDDQTFSFYETVRPEQAGTVALHGCLVTDEVGAAAAGEAPDYNFIGAAAEEAAKDVCIPQDAYAGWSQGAYAERNKPVTAGYQEILCAEKHPVRQEEAPFTTWVVLALCTVCAVTAAALLYGKKKRRLPKFTHAAVLPETVQKIHPADVPMSAAAAELSEQQRAVCKQLAAQKILSRREADVLLLLLQNKKRTEIADTLCVTENTVKTHIANIYSKLKVGSRSELTERVQGLSKAQKA